METLLFWVPPALLVLLGLKGKLMTGWRLFVCGGLALYLGVWVAPGWSGLLDFLPAEAEPFRMGMAILSGTLVFFCILFAASRGLAQRKDDEFTFPRVPEWIINALCRMCFGIFLSTFAFLLCAATPLRASLRNNGDGFEALATTALLRITAVGDTLTCCRPAEPRTDAVTAFWYAPPPLPVEEPEKAGNAAKGAPPAGKTDREQPHR